MSIQAFREKWSESLAAQESEDLALRDSLRAEAKTIAQEFVKANEATLSARYGHLDEHGCVAMVTHLRSQGMMDQVDELKMWIMANYAPKVIKGSMGPGPRIVRMRGR